MAYDQLNMETFGGNSGQQGVFDRNDRTKRSQALERLRALTEQYGEQLDPDYQGDGRSPYSGSITGVVDPTWWFNRRGQEFIDKQNAQVEAQNIGRSLGGKAPLSIRSLVGER